MPPIITEEHSGSKAVYSKARQWAVGKPEELFYCCAFPISILPGLFIKEATDVCFHA